MKKITKVGLGFAAVAATVTAGTIVVVAAGNSGRPTFTMANPADYVVFNSIIDNEIGDERTFVAASQWTGNNKDNNFTDDTQVEDGKEYVVRMYVHNNAKSSLGLVANNVRAYVNLPTNTATSIEVHGKIYSSNAKPTEVSDGTRFVSKNGKKFNLAYVDGSASYSNIDKNGNKRTFKLTTDLFTTTGSLLGYDKMDGNIPGCNEYSGYLTFHVKAQFEKEEETSDLNIQKEVQIDGTDGWSESVQAKAGDTIRYRLHVTNTGNTQIDNVSVRDILPAGMSYVKGSTIMKNTAHPDGVALNDGITGKGVNIGSMKSKAGAYIFFKAKVDSAVFDKCGNTLLRNVAQVIGDKVSKVREDGADVTVNGKTCTDGFTLDKKVRIGTNEFAEDIKAKAGDKVEYRIQFKNTGNTDLNNVVIRDVLPENMTYVKNSTKVEDKSVADGVISDKGINIGTVKAGKTVNIYFFVTVNGALADVCEDVNLVNTAKAKYNNDDKTEKSDTAVVKIDGKDCSDKDRPGFTINKMVQLDGGKDWAENVTAKAGDKLRYRIQFKNIGNTTLNNVVIRDILPAGVSYVKGSTVLYNAENTNGKTLDDGIVSAQGINIGSYAKGTTATIYFYATVDGAYADKCDDSVLTNVAKGKYNNDDKTEKSDTADVTVNGKECKDTPPTTPPTTPELPKTGAETVISSVVGAAGIATAATYYIISRKKLN